VQLQLTCCDTGLWGGVPGHGCVLAHYYLLSKCSCSPPKWPAVCCRRLTPGSASCTDDAQCKTRCQLLWCRAADIVLFRDPFDPASNPFADAEMYFPVDAGPTAAEPAGTVNTGMIGMRDGPTVRHQSLDMPWCVAVALYEARYHAG
jgi:hypothetical protein